MTFKDEIKAADAKAADGKVDAATASDSDDIARLLRALNEDLKADPRTAPTDGHDGHDEDDEDEDAAEAGGTRNFPLGKIALALLAAGGVGLGVVMFGGSTGTDAPTPGQTVAVAPPASPPPLMLNPKPAGGGAPESLIARAPAAAPAPVPAAPAAAPAPVPPIPAPPGRVEPAPVPPAVPAGTQTVVKPIEPPAMPKIDAPKPAEVKAPAAKPAENKPAEVKAPEILKAPEPKAAEPKVVEPKVAEPKAPDARMAEAAAPPAQPKTSEPKPPEASAAELQAMLSPPKPAQPTAKGGKAKATPTTTPAAPAAAPASRPAASATGRWMVQAGSFGVVENAEAVRRRLAAKGYTAQVIDWTDSSQRAWKVVRVGGYDSPADAKRVAEELKTGFGLSPIVVSAR